MAHRHRALGGFAQEQDCMQYAVLFSGNNWQFGRDRVVVQYRP